MIITTVQRFICNPSTIWVTYFYVYIVFSEFVPFLIIALRLNKRVKKKKADEFMIRQTYLNASRIGGTLIGSQIDSDISIDYNHRKEH